MSEFDANLSWLANAMGAPLLGTIPHLESPSAETTAEYLDLSLLG